MNTWTDDQLEHDAWVRARLDGLVARYREQVTRGMVAAGLLRGHFGPDGSFCVGHFAPDHGAMAGQLDVLDVYGATGVYRTEVAATRTDAGARRALDGGQGGDGGAGADLSSVRGFASQPGGIGGYHWQ